MDALIKTLGEIFAEKNYSIYCCPLSSVYMSYDDHCYRLDKSARSSEYFVTVGSVDAFEIFGTHCSCPTYSYSKSGWMW